ncbi:hypothetical protein ACX80O_16655, partial [Arthrobacter sp. Hz1]
IYGNESFRRSVLMTEVSERPGLADISGIPVKSRPGLERRLSLLVQVNMDMSFATVMVRGSLTPENCESLIRVIARTSYLAPDLSITVDLSEAKTIDREAMSRLRNYPSWTIVGAP